LFFDVIIVHDLYGARGLLQLYAVQVVYADGSQRLLLVLLLVLHHNGQFGLGPVQRHVNRSAGGFVRIAAGTADVEATASYALQVLRGFDESVVVGARGRELWRNERQLLLRTGRRRHRRCPRCPTAAVRRVSYEVKTIRDRRPT